MKVDEIIKYFVLNNQKFSRQAIKTTENENGKKTKIVFYEINEKLSKAYIQQHINGQHTIGVFPVLDDKTKWFCIDIDIVKEVYEAEDFDFDSYKGQLNELAERIKARFSHYDISAYKEETGGKGMHLWIFLEAPMKVNRMLQSFLPVLKSIEYDKKIFDVEWYPTSKNSKSVKLPGGINLRYNKFSRLEVPMDNIKRCAPRLVFDLTNPLETVFTGCEAFVRLKEKADIEKKLRHRERVAIASMCYNLDQSYLDFVEKYFFTDLDPYDPETTQKNLLHFSQKVRPIKCSTMQEQGICEKQCEAIKNNKTPASFLWEAQQEAKEARGELKIIDPQEFLEVRNNSFLERSRNNELMMISNYAVDITESQEIIGDDGEIFQTILAGTVTTHRGEEYPFEIPLSEYHKNETLIAKIYETLRIGGASYVAPRKIEQIRQCIDKFSRPSVIRKTRNFGFNADATVYYSPSVRIDKEAIVPNNEIMVDLTSANGELEQYLDLSLDNPIRGEEYWKDFLKTTLPGIYTNKSIILAMLSHVFNLFLKPYYGILENDSPYILWFAGESGLGKSRLMNIAQRMFGPFPKMYSFTSTPGRIEYTGYFYKDAIYAVDDYKMSNFTEYQKGLILSVLQNYADKTGRSRLNRNIEAQKSYWIRGNLLINGEDIIVQEGSNIARTVAIPLRQTDITIDHKIYDEVQRKSLHINELTPHIIKWCFNLDAKEIDMERDSYILRYKYLCGNAPNAARIIANYARFTVGGLRAAKYLYSEEEYPQIKEEFEKFADDAFLRQIELIKEENVTGKFWNCMLEMLATNKIRIVGGTTITDDIRGVPAIGFIKDMNIYIIQQLAHKAVTEHLAKVNPMNITSRQLAENLHNQKYYTTNSAIRKYFNGKQVRVFQLDIEKQKELLEDQNDKEEENNNS